jgi:hypothetical protein
MIFLALPGNEGAQLRRKITSLAALFAHPKEARTKAFLEAV